LEDGGGSSVKRRETLAATEFDMFLPPSRWSSSTNECHRKIFGSCGSPREQGRAFRRNHQGFSVWRTPILEHRERSLPVVSRCGDWL